MDVRYEDSVDGILLQHICRLCSGPTKNSDRNFIDKLKFSRDIKLSLNIDVAQDKENQPPFICLTCRAKLQRWRKQKNKKLEQPINITTIPRATSNQTVVSTTENNDAASQVVGKSKLTPATPGDIGYMSITVNDGKVFVKLSSDGRTVLYRILYFLDKSWQAFVNGVDVTTADCLEAIPRHLETETELPALILKIENLKICMGNHDFHMLNKRFSRVYSSAHLEDLIGDLKCAYLDCFTWKGPTIKHKFCSYITDSKHGICMKCSIFRNSLRSEKSRSRKEAKSASPRRAHSSMSPAQLKKRLQDRKKECAALKKQLHRLRKKIEKQIEEEGELLSEGQTEMFTAFFDKFDVGSFTPGSPQQILWECQKQHMTVKNKKNMRWHPLVLRWCIAIAGKSTSTYNLLRDTGFLSLPHINTLRKYSKFTTPSVGLNADVFEFVMKDFDLETLPEYKRDVCLLFDEIKLKAGVAFSKKSGNVVGFCDLGPMQNELEKFEHLISNKDIHPEPATHMLVLMVRGLLASFKFPIAFFPTCSASSDQLYTCIWPTVEALEVIGLHVRAFVSDGAAANRKFYKMHQCSSVQSEVQHFTYNPCNPGSKIYFICDVPHLMKTTRNNWENSGWNKKSRNLHVDKQDIKWPQLLSLVEQDMDYSKGSCSFGLRKLHKIRPEHLHLDPSLRMRVSLAVQVLSTSVSKAFEVQGRHDTKAVTKFTHMFDTFFDCLNVSNIFEGQRKRKKALEPYRCEDDWRFKWLLDDFLGYLKDWENQCMATPNTTLQQKRRMCLSQQTLEGLRITVMSFVCLGKELLKLDGVEYFLSEKLCQDPLEEHFSKQRAQGGRNENPTVSEYGHNEVSLLVSGSHTLSSMKGNCRNQKRRLPLAEINANVVLPKVSKKV